MAIPPTVVVGHASAACKPRVVASSSGIELTFKRGAVGSRSGLVATRPRAATKIRLPLELKLKSDTH